MILFWCGPLSVWVWLTLCFYLLPYREEHWQDKSDLHVQRDLAPQWRGVGLEVGQLPQNERCTDPLVCHMQFCSHCSISLRWVDYVLVPWWCHHAVCMQLSYRCTKLVLYILILSADLFGFTNVSVLYIHVHEWEYSLVSSRVLLVLETPFLHLCPKQNPGILALIIIRTLRRDIARYNKDEEMVCLLCSVMLSPLTTVT